MIRANLVIKLKQWGKKIAVFVGIILAIFVVAKIIGALVQISYNPQEQQRQEEIKEFYDTPIFGENEIANDKKMLYSNTIADFVNYGNNKEYEKIFNMLSPEYKELKMEDVSKVKEYIDIYFDSQKGFSYQNMINSDNLYVYEVKIFDDLMLSGANTYSSDNQHKLYVVINDNEGVLNISLDGFISKENVNVSTENEYIKFTILSKEIYYDHVKFNLQMENLTNDRILTVYDEDIDYLLYNKQSKKITEYENNYNIVTGLANKVMPKEIESVSIQYNRYMGASVLLDYRINIDKIYSYNLSNYMEVLFDNPNITEKAIETYSNIYISL